MALVVTHFEFDTSALVDALDLIGRAHLALASRHGPRFRQLDRDITAWADGDWGELPIIQHPGGYQFTVGAWASLANLLRRARELGVI